MSQRLPTSRRLRLGVSGCLLGANVRFDGGHKRDRFLTGPVAELVDFVSVCPEVELGLGTPRETLRLVRDQGRGVRLVAPASGRDLTEGMQALAGARAAQLLAGRGLSGFILKKDSPSCGLERVRVYDANGVPSKTGRGLFAHALRLADPHLPIEEEGRLKDPLLRESFFERAFAYDRVRALFAGDWTLGDLVAFHSREKLQIMAHDPQRYRQLGRLVAHAKPRARSPQDRAELAAEYVDRYMTALARLPSRGRHTNVLQHMLGYVSDALEAAERAELVELLQEYQRGWVPRGVPFTLLRHHVRRQRVTYVADQTYLEPYPRQLKLMDAA